MQNSQATGRKRLLDLWVPPEGAGEPVGCIATSYTFDSMFFEEECLGRFLGIESDPSTDGTAYLIEREEKLSCIKGAIALVDQRHCCGARNIRWDFVPVRIKPGIFHPKVSLLCWKNHVRVLVGSANLTKSGYRYNQELMAALDLNEESLDLIPAVSDVLSFFDKVLSLGDNSAPHFDRSKDIVYWTRERVSRFAAGYKNKRNARTSCAFIPVYPDTNKQNSVFQQVEAVFIKLFRRPADGVRVVSPFYDDVQGTAYKPAQSLWNILRKSGEANVTYGMPMLPVENNENYKWQAWAPIGSIKSATPCRAAAHISFERFEEKEIYIGNECNRPLHMKSMYFTHSRWEGHLIGSSNFTSAGTGLSGGRNNIEANLLFIEKRPQKGKLSLSGAKPIGTTVSSDELQEESAVDRNTEDADTDTNIIPYFFNSVVYYSDYLQFDFRVESLYELEGKSWRIINGITEGELYSSSIWDAEKRPDNKSIHIKTSPPSGCWIEMSAASNKIWWPVSLRDKASLPPPEELRNLDFDILIQILSSARPLHRFSRMLANHSHEKKSDYEENAVVDPHKKVDVSAFILQRTRKASWALDAIRERMEKPVVSEDQLSWRLRGPIGVKAFVDAILKSEKTDSVEKVFLLTEIALELHRVTLRDLPGCLSPHTIRKELDEFVIELQKLIDEHLDVVPLQIHKYVKSVFNDVGEPV